MRYLSIVVLLCVLFTATAMAGSPQSVNPGPKVHPSLSDKFAGKSDSDTVRVIVSLAASQPPGLTRAQAIAESQGRVLGAFTKENNGAGLKVLARYQTLYGFSAELNHGQARALAKRGDVEFIEEMPVHKKLYTESHPLTDVDLAQGDYDGTGAVIAIIDDGIDAAHPAFDGKLLGGYDFADFDNDPTIGCADQDHGTAVAGVALGNGGGALGVAPGAKMVFLKIQSSKRRYCGGTSLGGDLVAAIDWATANKDTYGIDIISMSLGGGLYSSESSCNSSSTIYRDALNNAVNAGITVIAASGNDGMCDAMSRPACFSSVVSVGAVYDEDIGEAGWCIDNNSCANPSYNPGCPTGYGAFFENSSPDNVIVYSNSASFLDVTAPATCAKSAAPNNSTTDCFGGTSSATPFTSGTAALAVEAAGKGVLSPEDMRTVLVGTGNSVTDPKNGRVTPRVNGLNAVIEAETYGGGTPVNNPPQASYSFSCTYLECSFSDSSSDSDGSVVTWSWNFDGDGSSTQQNPSHVFSSAGTYNVQLSVSDNDGDSDSISKSVTVIEAPATNVPPTASFNFDCTDLDCSFTDTSGDSDGTIASHSWTFGDGSNSSAVNPSHSYVSGGTYTVSLTVTDNDGATDSSSQSVTVTAPDPGDANLVSSSTSVRNKWTAAVWWSDGDVLSGEWSTGATCDNQTTCTLSGINKKVGSVVFTASTGESITVNKP